MVGVSAWSPSKQPTSSGNPWRSTSRPTTICGSTRRSLEKPDLAQVVLLVGLEVQRRDVVQAQRHVPAGQGMREARRRDLVPIRPRPLAGPLGVARGIRRLGGGGDGTGQGPSHRGVAGRRAAQIGQHPGGVQQRGRLHDPGDDQVTEHLVADRVEPQRGVHPCQGLEQHSGVRGHHPRGTGPHRCLTALPTGGVGGGEQLRLHRPPSRLGQQRRDQRRRLDAQVECVLPGRFKQLTGLRDQDPELDLRMRRPDVLDDPLPPLDVLSDLHRRRSRRRPHPPDEHHTTTLEPAPSA